MEGHGRLMDPPARNAMWRFGYPNAVNYNDNELFCGGYAGILQLNNHYFGLFIKKYTHFSAMGTECWEMWGLWRPLPFPNTQTS